MVPPSRDQIEQMAFMAMMDGIIHTSVPCNCAACKNDQKSREITRPQQTKRATSDNQENTKPSSKAEPAGACNHSHPVPESKLGQSTRKPGSVPPPNRAASASTNPARSDKVNALLKADNVQAVLDVFNLTSTSKPEKDLATNIQNATKDCKLYQETKDKILELCDDDEIDLDAVFGLLAKFRYERNMLTTAVIKGNSEREKALLCIQRVDHLMYMLQDVAKKKDSKGNDAMHKLGDIIMEIHDLAKTPSSLYDEFLDIKEEHFDLLNDHEDMHQKFVDVNSCHEKLHSSHDKLQSDHTKLLRDLNEMKKKAGTAGGLRNDVTRLEKAVDKSHDENSDLKKEIGRLNAELAKVNALKHENAQLKKKVTTLSTQSTLSVENAQAASQAQTSKKKKGKKTTPDGQGHTSTSTEPTTDLDGKLAESEKAHAAEITKLRRAHDVVNRELELVRTNLKQLDALLRKAENSRDQAVEKLEVEKATARNWKDIAKGRSSERDRLQTEVDRHVTRATKLQSTVEELEHSLNGTKLELAEQLETQKHLKEELENRPPSPAVSTVSHQNTTTLSPDMIRLLRKIRSETTQLVRDMDDSRSFNGDVYSIFDMIQLTVRRAVSAVERDIEEILSVKGNEPLISNHNPVPDAVLPFVYNNPPSRQMSQFSSVPEYSPQESPCVLPSTTLPPYRPMPPPPGFESSPSPYAYNQLHTYPPTRNLDSPSAPFSRIAEPPGLTAKLGFNRAGEPLSASRYSPLVMPSSLSLHSHSSLHNSNNIMPAPNVGVIGSRSVSSKLTATPSPISTPTPSVGSGTTGGPTSTTAAPGPSALGNGAVGVDWNMWTKPSR